VYSGSDLLIIDVNVNMVGKLLASNNDYLLVTAVVEKQNRDTLGRKEMSDYYFVQQG